MSWRGTLRSMQAAQRRYEREAKRTQRLLEQQQNQLEKMEEQERARYEVQVYENYLEVLQSIHRDCGNSWDWESIRASAPPARPLKSDTLETAAQEVLDGYKPTTADKVLRRADAKRQELAKAVEDARLEDEAAFQEALAEHEEELAQWQIITEIAGKILADKPEAHLEAISEIDPFSEIEQLGSNLDFRFHGNLVEVTLRVRDENIIPSETKTLLKSGKVSVKPMAKSRFYALYQDYVCGAVLRVARELFALLPIEMVLVTAVGSLLNTQTGHREDHPILSVAVPRKTLDILNFDTLDPSDAMRNFVYRMNFKKTSGFAQVVPIVPDDLQLLE